MRPLGRGHIHATLLVETAQGHRYVAQRINTAVFGDPVALARNLERVTAHLATRAAGRPTLEPLRTPAGRSTVEDSEGGWWRVFPFVEGSRSVERARSPAEAEGMAAAFGGFLADLADLPTRQIEVLLPGFHDLAGRLAALEAAAARDALGRRAAVEPELRRARALGLELAAADDALPRRLVHNDCKLNNLLVDASSGEPLCVVDLDTVMPGLALYDFGELVRTAASTADEDEPDVERVDFDLARFEALARGFVAGARGGLTLQEIRSFDRAGPRMALENGVRFLADHLDGDRYFPARRPGHNLDRARAQLRLAERMLQREAELRDLVQGLVRPGNPG